VLLPGFQKGRDIKPGFLGKRAGSSFGQKRAICVVQGKTRKIDRISLLLGSIKCFPISFNTFKTL
jgi:hypothetical protein